MSRIVQTARYKAANPELVRKWDFAAALKYRYGITLEQWDAMFKAQKGRCLICHKKKKLCVDHDHKTGRVRGLLCSGCNGHLGWYESVDPALIEAYLKRDALK